jgi:glycosyltransferase involved in cell wall biosynthesis
MTPITSIAVLVCTRNRPAELVRVLSAIGNFRLPPNVQLVTVVVDNGDAEWRGRIQMACSAVGMNVVYAREAERGYSSVRNAALDVALATGAEVFLWLDDDDIPDLNCALRHIRDQSLDGVDIVAGWQDGTRDAKRLAHLSEITQIPCGNSSMKRWIAARGLRFDPRLNFTGSEDVEFYRDAIAMGAKAAYSHGPKIYRSSANATLPRLAGDIFVAAKGQNKIYVRRIRYGLSSAMLEYARIYVPRLLIGFAMACVGSARGIQYIRRHNYALRGLYRPGLDRALLKEGIVQEIA